MAKFKVVAIGKPAGSSSEGERAELGKLKLDIEFADPLVRTEDEFIAAARDADIVLLGAGTGMRGTRKVIEGLKKTAAVVLYSVGFDKIDIDAATENGILVANNPAPGWCVEEVSNQAIVLLLACAKKLTWFNDLTRQGRWTEARRTVEPMASIHGQTLGLIGCGDIGRMTARKAQPFGLKVLGYDPYLTKSLADEYQITMVSLPDLLRQADFVSLHAPLTKETFHLLKEQEFKMMKRSAYIINTARGQIMDEAALIKALQEKTIAGAGLDTFEKEPVDLDNPLLRMDNVVVTPHSGSMSEAARKMQFISAARYAGQILTGHRPVSIGNNPVNPRMKLAK